MKYGARRRGREAALQLLYQIDLSGDPEEPDFELFWRDAPKSAQVPESRELAEGIVRRVIADLEHLDQVIGAAADNWQLDRMSRVDLALMRLATSELLNSPEVPAAVVVDEAVDIARRFSGNESAAFINGVLDRVAREHGRL